MTSNGIFVIIATFLIIGTSFILAMVIGNRSKKSSADWNIGGRNLPLYVIIGTQFASAMGGGVIVGQVGNAYNVGISMILYGLFASLPYIAFLVIGNWIRAQEFETIPDMIGRLSYENKTARIIAAVLTIIVPFGWLISQMVAFAKMYTQITGIPLNILIVAMAVLSLLFVMPAGMKTVAWTDFFFACAMVIVCTIVIIYTVTVSGATPAAISAAIPAENHNLGNAGAATIVTWLIACLPGGMTNQMYYQRVCAIGNPKRVNTSLIISGIALFAAFGWSCYMGNAIRFMNPNLEGENATGWLLTVMPVALIALFAALITSTIMSTISSAVQSVVVNCTHDIYQTVNPKVDEKNLLTLSRVLSALVLAIAAFLGINNPEVLNWIVNTYAYSAAGLCLPMYLGYLLSKKKFVTPAGLIASMVCGIAGCVVAQILNTSIPFVVIGIAASLVALLIGCAVTKDSFFAAHPELQ